ncbi:MAG: tRNA(Ile)-lysidine synthetase, partial [Chloroflexi bacterium]|nr:tRNA(Ile)-lysidine synthetase [Chloroflexota bacterium]
MPASSTLLERVRAFIGRENLLPAAEAPVVVGVSGGADSLTLAHILGRLGYRLVIAHLDHGL